jgi:hypothetical protein
MLPDSLGQQQSCKLVLHMSWVTHQLQHSVVCLVF